MLLRRSLKQCIDEIKLFLREDVGEHYEKFFAEKMQYIPNKLFALKRSNSSAHSSVSYDLSNLSLMEQQPEEQVEAHIEDVNNNNNDQMEDVLEKQSSPVMFSVNASKNRQPFLSFNAQPSTVANIKLRNGYTWGELMTMPADSFEACYNNMLKDLKVLDLTALKRIIIIRFVRALEQIESNMDLSEAALKTAVDNAADEATSFLELAREDAKANALYMQSLQITHGAGQSELLVQATQFVLEHAVLKMEDIDPDEYMLPCENIFELTNEMLQNTRNVLLRALEKAFDYFAWSHFREKSERDYSIVNSVWSMVVTEIPPSQRRAHWESTINNLQKCISKKANLLEDRTLEFSEGEKKYLEKAIDIIQSAISDVAATYGESAPLYKSYNQISVLLSQQHGHCSSKSVLRIKN